MEITHKRKIVLASWGILLSVSIAILAISYFHLLDNFELETLDLRFRIRPHIRTTDKVVMVEIGEDTIEKLGRFPFERSYHALLVKALSENGAKAIIFDIFFSEPAETDPEFEEALRHSGNAYLPFVFNVEKKSGSRIPEARGYLAKEIEKLGAASKGQGHINLYPDIDGKFRRVPLFIKYGEKYYPYISFLACLDYLGIAEKDIRIVPGRYVNLGQDLNIPLDEDSNMLINFSGKWGSSYQHYSYIDILQSYLAGLSGQKPVVDLSLFRDKVCIIGLTAAGTVDLHPNPFETLYPGVGIHAEVFNSILSRNFISRASKGLNLLVLFIVGLFVSLITLKLKPLRALAILTLANIVFVISAVLLFNYRGIWIDLFYPIFSAILCYLALTLYRYVGEWKRRVLMENELDIAKKIQESFLPRKLPAIDGIDIAATMYTARKVGGDLYDFVEFDKATLGVMIGDVSGKGVPASLFMAMVTGKFKFFADAGSKPEDVLSKLNSILVKESSSNLFVTVFYSIFDVKNRTLSYSNGGHLPLAHVSHDGRLEFLDVDEGTPLGLMDGPYGGGVAKFNKDDVFVFYTDGITEAMNAKSDMYGKERLASVIQSNRALSARALLNAIEKDVRRFEPESTQHDDMTVIVLKITE